jgi:ABC-type transport system substrate-binding protein
MSRILVSIIDFVTDWEHRLYLILGTLFIGSLSVLLMIFYRENTILIPTEGGTYIEGSIGELRPLNPWFTVTNDVNRDIVSLVFAGLMRYNPETKEIEEDLASVDISKDGKIYTATLKDDLFWHDSTEDNPHPVTADDVLFTFKTVQDPQFPNSLLTQNFQGVGIEKLDERTVQFRLSESYSFFPSNLTLGLLPAQSFENVPISKLDQVLDFGFAPIGAGPYRFKSIVQTEISSEVTLEQFPRSLSPKQHRLHRIVFRIFPEYPSLFSDLRNLDGIRLIPRNNDGKALVPQQFTAQNYTLPQYVALFFNLYRPIMQDKQLRLGLQLGTNKQDIVDSINESIIVDTPLLEIDISDWRYQFDQKSAQGALFESKWYFPEKVRLQRLLEKREANDIGPLRIDPIVLLDTGAVLTITGSLTDAPMGSTVNSIDIQKNPKGDNEWIVALPTHGGTGSLTVGENLVRLIDRKGNVIDSFYVWRTTNAAQYRSAALEQELLDLFLTTRANAADPTNRVTTADLVFDKGFLRKRTKSDPVDIRINEEGKQLSLRLLTSPSPPSYAEVAKRLKAQWRELGVNVQIDIPDTRVEFQKKLLTRNYDILLFGQSLLDNLDSYPYWHSDGVQKEGTSERDVKLDAYNLSQYISFEADTLLTTIRETVDDTERQSALADLREVIKQDVPAIFLYSPLYTFAYHKDILGVELGKLSLHSDRFLTLWRWYVQQNRVFKTGHTWWSFWEWLTN